MGPQGQMSTPSGGNWRLVKSLRSVINVCSGKTILLLYREEEEEAVITILIPCNRGRGLNMKDGAAFLDDGSNGKLCVSGIYSASKMKWKLSPKQLGGRIRKY